MTERLRHFLFFAGLGTVLYSSRLRGMVLVGCWGSRGLNKSGVSVEPCQCLWTALSIALLALGVPCAMPMCPARRYELPGCAGIS